MVLYWAKRCKNTLLHNASREGNLEMVRLLIKKGAHINVELSSGITPLFLASVHGHNEIVKYLIENKSVRYFAYLTTFSHSWFNSISLLKNELRGRS